MQLPIVRLDIESRSPRPHRRGPGSRGTSAGTASDTMKSHDSDNVALREQLALRMRVCTSHTCMHVRGAAAVDVLASRRRPGGGVY